jgi:protein-S-isoprenylcysteine O-methyltransferase Ste14
MKSADYSGYAWTAAQWLVLALVLWTGWHFCRPEGAPWISLLGGAVMTASIVPALLGFLHLGSNLSPWPQPHAGNQLVTRGIYRHLRHPLYSSLIIFAFGWAAWRQSWPALLAAVALCLVLKRKIAHEEALLTERHLAYTDYALATGCFLPRWGGKKCRTSSSATYGN